jgi:hypothetical protein
MAPSEAARQKWSESNATASKSWLFGEFAGYRAWRVFAEAQSDFLLGLVAQFLDITAHLSGRHTAVPK